MSNFMKVSSENAPRVELHNKLGLTGAEISINTIQAGEGVPFIHSSKDNSLSYVCIQVKENSLENFTANDAIIK